MTLFSSTLNLDWSTEILPLPQIFFLGHSRGSRMGGEGRRVRRNRNSRAQRKCASVTIPPLQRLGIPVKCRQGESEMLRIPGRPCHSGIFGLFEWRQEQFSASWRTTTTTTTTRTTLKYLGEVRALARLGQTHRLSRLVEEQHWRIWPELSVRRTKSGSLGSGLGADSGSRNLCLTPDP